VLIDTHSHVFFEDYDQDRAEVIHRAKSAGVQILINVGVDIESNIKAAGIANTDDSIYASVGFHPHSAHTWSDSKEREIRDQIDASPKVVAVGEVGLDYFKSEADRETQIKVFTRMSEIAAERKLPLIVHSRDAFEDTFKILNQIKSKNSGFKAVFHCYTYDAPSAQQIAEAGFLVSFSGIVTFKNAVPVQEAAKILRDGEFVIETDCPYLAPEGHRGGRNEPAFLRAVAERIAQLRNVPAEHVAQVTTRAASNFFGIKL
jgi:TatD DNase family protein